LYGFENIIVCDSRWIISKSRTDLMMKRKIF
jgi:hypothetical protein